MPGARPGAGLAHGRGALAQAAARPRPALGSRPRARVDLPLTSVDNVVRQALPPGKVAPRAVLVQALVAAGYTKGSAEVTVHRMPYLTQAARGLVSR